MTAGWSMRNRVLLVDSASDPGHPRVALERQGASWTTPVIALSGKDFLPRVMRGGQDFWHTVEPMNARVRERLGLEVTALRCLETRDDPKAQVTRSLWVLDVRTKHASLAPPMAWVPVDQLHSLPFADEQTRSFVQSWERWDRATPLSRVPWSRPGWWEAAGAAVARKIRLEGPLVQMRVWERSTVLRTRAAGADAYLKASPAVFAHESAVVAWLAEHVPGRVPALLGTGREEAVGSWFLSADHQGQGLDSTGDFSLWEGAFGAYGQLQRESLSGLTELRGGGCPERPLRELVEPARRLIADTPVLERTENGLSGKERRELQQALPAILDAVTALDAGGIPSCLEHGDLWSGQVAWRATPKGPAHVFLDWSDSSIAHPFLSLFFFLADAEGVFESEDGAVERLLDAYLAEWTDFAPWDELRRLARLALIVAPLHHAVAYYDTILPSFEFPWEMEPTFYFHLRALHRNVKGLAGQ